MTEFEDNNNKPHGVSRQQSLTLSKWIWLVPTIALVLALLPLPYTFYMGLRWLVASAAAILAWNEIEQNERQINSYATMLLGVALLYNPIIPIYLFKMLWVFLNLITAAIFLVHYKVHLHRQESPIDELE